MCRRGGVLDWKKPGKRERGTLGGKNSIEEAPIVHGKTGGESAWTW